MHSRQRPQHRGQQPTASKQPPHSSWHRRQNRTACRSLCCAMHRSPSARPRGVHQRSWSRSGRFRPPCSCCAPLRCAPLQRAACRRHAGEQLIPHCLQLHRVGCTACAVAWCSTRIRGGTHWLACCLLRLVVRHGAPSHMQGSPNMRCRGSKCGALPCTPCCHCCRRQQSGAPASMESRQRTVMKLCNVMWKWWPASGMHWQALLVRVPVRAHHILASNSRSSGLVRCRLGCAYTWSAPALCRAVSMQKCSPSSLHLTM